MTMMIIKIKKKILKIGITTLISHRMKEKYLRYK